MADGLQKSATVRLNKIQSTASSHQNYGKSHRALPGSEPSSAEFQKRQLTAMRKATEPTEQPPKEKHVRFLLLGCAHEKKASTFWWSARQLPLSSQPVTAWKFFYILHRLIKQSSQAVTTAGGTSRSVDGKKLSPILSDCFQFHSHMKQIGGLWKGMLHMPYASLIAEYSVLIDRRLSFHKKFQEEMPGGELEFNDKHLSEDVNYRMILLKCRENDRKWLKKS